MRDPRIAGLIAVYSVALVVILAVAALRGDGSGGEEAQAAVTRPAARAVAARPLTVAWGGDVTLGSAYGLPPSSGWPLLAPLASTLRAADVAAVNYEGTLGVGAGSKCGSPARTNCYAFQAPPANARTLRRAGI